MLIENQTLKQWCTKMTIVAINSSPISKECPYSPCQLLFGRNAVTILDAPTFEKANCPHSWMRARLDAMLSASRAKF